MDDERHVEPQNGDAAAGTRQQPCSSSLSPDGVVFEVVVNVSLVMAITLSALLVCLIFTKLNSKPNPIIQNVFEETERKIDLTTHAQTAVNSRY